MKRCRACQKEQVLSEFTRRSAHKDGLENRCRLCTSEFNKSYTSPVRLKRIAESTAAREQRDAEVVELYIAGAPLKTIQKRFRISESSLEKALKSANIPSRTRARKYPLNQEYFAEIDTEEKAYWLGFIAADGNLHRGVLSVRLAAVDEDHLHKLRKALTSDQPIRLGSSPGVRGAVERNEWCQVRFSSTRLVEHLKSQGITENKSLTLSPSPVPEHLERHYWRGVIDGDGSIVSSTSSREKWTPFLHLVGSREMVEGFVSYLRKIGVDSKMMVALATPTSRHYRTGTGKRSSVQTALEVLYGDATVFLDRKKEKADYVLERLNASVAS